ncbi:MAG TPA: hypothetical protein VNL92_03580, partial [Dehalococcoidia bacterium]|nr:hypothetical protein [Dehalococcoidia bacterium]
VRGRVMSLLQLNMGVSQFLTLPLAAIAQATSIELLFPTLALVVMVLVGAIVVGQRHRFGAAISGTRIGLDEPSVQPSRTG